MDELASAASRHESVDTYAKKLYFGNQRTQTTLNDLKVLLSTYFSFEQSEGSGKVDPRYDGFLASTLIDDDSLPMLSKEVLLLNWNYDLQLAMAYREYLPECKIIQAMEMMGMSSLDRLHGMKETPRVVHLNGLAASLRDGAIEPIFDVNHPTLEHRIAKAVLTFMWSKNNWEILKSHRYQPTLLRFAWELDEQVKQGLARLSTLLSDVEVLVVIGYFFPFFNREVDRKVVGDMIRLKKVYIQSKDTGIKAVVNAFRAIPLSSDVKVETYDSVDKFLLPPEL